jgi:hypothetical protein
MKNSGLERHKKYTQKTGMSAVTESIISLRRIIADFVFPCAGNLPVWTVAKGGSDNQRGMA